MDSDNTTQQSLANAYDIDTLFDSVAGGQYHPQEVFHEMLQTFTLSIAETVNPLEFAKEVLTFSRRLTDLFVEREFGITYE